MDATATATDATLPQSTATGSTANTYSTPRVSRLL
jgi:hypothetical protein